MTEELTTELAQISSLKVISHTSVAQYKGTKKSLPQIARELGVDAVVEGAVERWGDKVGITMQLIHAPSDRHLWAKSYERDLGNVLDLQREVTHAIVDEIQAKLTVPEKARLASVQSVDAQAHEDYLKGRFSWEKAELRKSIAYFQRAIQETPNYALAYAGLANAYISLGQPWFPEGDLRPKDVLPQAEAAAREALQIDPALGDAHLALARVIQIYDWDWPAVEREYRKALELNQNNAQAHAFFGEYLQQMGRNEESLAEWRRAVELDPLDRAAAADVGFAFYTARQYDSAIQAFQKALELDPDYVGTHVGLGWVYQQKKMYPDAILELQKAVDLSNRHEVPLASLGQVMGESGRKQEAARILEELRRRSQQRYISPCVVALVQIGLGEREQAIASLEQGYNNRDQWMLYLKVDPHMDDLRTDPRFQDLVRRVAIPQ
jgi:tetratricopeptide (TPR) repeat protein